MVHDWLRDLRWVSRGQSARGEAEVGAVLPDGYTSYGLVDVEVIDGTAVIMMCGDLDITVDAALSERLAEIMQKKPARLIFDLGGVEFMDCAAARTLLSAARSLPDGQRPVIRSAGPLVRRLLAVTRLDTQCVLDGQDLAGASADGAGRLLTGGLARSRAACAGG